MSTHEHEPATTTDFRCAACVAQLTEAEFQLLPETDAATVTEHLSQCPDCRLFNEQLDTTREILAATPTPEVTVDLAHVLGETGSEPADQRVEPSLDRLYRIAAALGVEDVDELVQQTLVDAIAQGAALDTGELIDRMTRTATARRGASTESLNQADPDTASYDPDSETAELFYPEFYEEGPDEGRFVDSPNDWGHALRLAPEAELATIELFKVTDSAIDELQDLGRRLITLVDLEGASLEDAALGSRVSNERAAQALNRARIHVRGTIDKYLNAAEA